MDVTSTAASTIQVNQKPNATKPDNIGKLPPTPEDANLKAIQTEIKQITDDMKDSKLKELPKDTVDFSNSKAQKIQEINVTTPAAPLDKEASPAPEAVKENTPAA